ncbi:MAG: septum site-determining protein MinC [Otoolea sp.]|nr:septum site-determining protein MinC [Clostridiaceae bacterium]
MQNSVVIKGSKAGLTVILHPDLPFEQLCEAVAAKFRESARFWGSVQMTLTLEGRTLSPAEELRIVDAITENSQIEILCLLETDGSRIARCEKALTERLMEISSRTGQFFRGDLVRGDVLESEASIVVIGNVAAGARITARGNVVILGSLSGSVHAGAGGNTDAVIAALEMAPVLLRIGNYQTTSREKGKRLGRGPMVASVSGESILVSSVKKSFINYFNFI